MDFKEVPRGPWSTHGENNTFVINDRTKGKTLVEKAGHGRALKRNDSRRFLAER